MHVRYCTTQASFARALTIHQRITHTQAQTLNTLQTFSLSHTSSHARAQKHTHNNTCTPLWYCTLWSTSEANRRTLARSELGVVGICAAYDRGMSACGKQRKQKVSRGYHACMIIAAKHVEALPRLIHIYLCWIQS